MVINKMNEKFIIIPRERQYNLTLKAYIKNQISRVYIKCNFFLHHHDMLFNRHL